MPTLGWAVEADNPVFRGFDPKLGARLSRVTVDLSAVEPVEDGPVVTSLQARRFYDGRAQFALQSFDAAIRHLEGNVLIVRVDGEAYEIPFQAYDTLVIGVPGRLPPIHQLWFGPLSRPLQARLLGAKQVSVEFATPSGAPAVYAVTESSTLKIAEAMQEFGAEGRSPNNPVQPTVGVTGMAPDRIFSVFFGTWIILGIATSIFYWKGSLEAKRRWHPWIVLVSGVLFVGFAYAVFGNSPALLLVVPATVLIQLLNYKFIKFCPSCSRTLHRNPPWSRMDFVRDAVRISTAFEAPNKPLQPRRRTDSGRPPGAARAAERRR
jgi:hypothetical protein